MTLSSNITDFYIEGGKPKAEVAASKLRSIFPGVLSRGVQLSIPMPGRETDSVLYRSTYRTSAVYTE